MNGSRSWVEKDFYSVLGVGEGASTEEIKRAYKKLAREYHPDRNPGDRAAEERMKDVSEAYDVLSDPAKRSEYDQVRRLARQGFGGPGGPAGGWESVDPSAFGFDLGDLFSAFGAGRRRGPRRGPDLEAAVRVSFDDAARGATIPVVLTRDAPCDTCLGTGDRSGAPSVCPQCGGSGTAGENQGLFSFVRACPRCGGNGRVVVNPCPTCHGSGVQKRRDTVRVKIPPGIGDGARIRVRGRGGAVPGGQPGDLYVVVQVDPHPVFSRRGEDLTVSIPVSFAEAVLGAKVSVPTLDGTPVTVKVPAGTQPGTTLRVRGKGIQRAKGRAGDLLVTVQVDVPTKLSREQRELIERLQALDEGAADRRAASV